MKVTPRIFRTGACCAVLGAALSWAATAQAQIRITEYTASPNPEWVEFTNVGSSPIDLTGWSWSDSDEQPFDQPSLGTVGVIASHESFIFTEADPATFRTLWGLPSTVKVVGDNTNSNLSSGGDEINIYDDLGNLVDRLTYTSAFNGVPTSRNVLLANLGTNQASLTVQSSVGDVFGSYSATDGRIGNPGIYAPIQVPEPASIALGLFGAVATLGFASRRHS